jgi:hypothetical protein
MRGGTIKFEKYINMRGGTIKFEKYINMRGALLNSKKYINMRGGTIKFEKYINMRGALWKIFFCSARKYFFVVKNDNEKIDRDYTCQTSDMSTCGQTSDKATNPNRVWSPIGCATVFLHVEFTEAPRGCSHENSDGPVCSPQSVRRERKK